MQLTPRYGPDPLITLDGAPSDIVAPLVRQRRRLTDTVSAFTDDQWAHPTRCEGWTAREVVLHLESTNSFWGFSIAMGLKGEPSRFLATFDPEASPKQLIEGAADISIDEALTRFVASSTALLDRLEGLDDAELSALAEAPPGHISVAALAHHALWDSWIHERDILLPQGITPDQQPDEIEAALRYAAALGPAFAASRGRSDTAAMAVSGSGPEVHAVVEVGPSVHVRRGDAVDADLRLTGPSVDLLEALSVRGPFPSPVPEDAEWLVSGLVEVFRPELG